LVARQTGIENCRRHVRRLACARRRAKHERLRSAKPSDDLWQDVING
jgi:hypothetical protein